jgi:hypothetical protein
VSVKGDEPPLLFWPPFALPLPEACGFGGLLCVWVEVVGGVFFVVDGDEECTSANTKKPIKISIMTPPAIILFLLRITLPPLRQQ